MHAYINAYVRLWVRPSVYMNKSNVFAYFLPKGRWPVVPGSGSCCLSFMFLEEIMPTESPPLHPTPHPHPPRPCENATGRYGL